MDEDLIASIRKTFEPYLTGSLRAIYEEKDLSKWSPEAFEAMRQILLERGVPGIPQTPAIPEPSAPTSIPLVTAEQRRSDFLSLVRGGGYAGGALGFFISFWRTDLALCAIFCGVGLAMAIYYLQTDNPRYRWRTVLASTFSVILMVALFGGLLGSAFMWIARMLTPSPPPALIAVPVRG